MANMDANAEYLAEQIEDLTARLEDKTAECELAAEALEQAKKELATSQDAATLKAAADKVAALEKEIADYEKLFAEYEAKLNAAQTAQDYHYNKEAFRQQQKLNKVYQKEASVAKAQLRLYKAEAEAKLASAKSEADKRVADAREELSKAQKNLEHEKEIFAHQMERLDVYSFLLRDIVLPKFATFYPQNVDLDKGSLDSIKFSRAVTAAKKSDSKYRARERKYEKATQKGKQMTQPQPEDKGYEAIVSACVENFNDFVEDLTTTSIGQRKYQEFLDKYKISESASSREIVEKVIEDNSKWNLKSTLKSKKVVCVLAGVAAVILAGVIAASVLGPSLADANDTIGSQNDTINSQNSTIETVTNMRDIVDEVARSEEGVEGNYSVVLQNDEHADQVSKVFSSGIATVSATSADENKLEQGYKDVKTAVSGAQAIVTLDENGQISADCAYGQAVSGFNAAVEANNVEQAQTYGQTISGYNLDMERYATSSSDGLTAMLDGAGISYEQVLDYMAQMSAPTVTLTFDQAALTQYRSFLSSKGKGGGAIGVESCVYTKDSGAVNMLVKCVNAEKQVYYNLISYNIESGLQNPTLADVMGPLERGELVSMQAYDQDLSTNVQGQHVQLSAKDGAQVSGNAIVKYSTSIQYNENSNSSKVTASALVLVTDADGNVVGVNTVTVTKNYQGRVSASAVESDMQEALRGKLNNVIQSTTVAATEIEDENNMG